MSPPGGDNGVTLRDVYLLVGETKGDVRALHDRVGRVEADQKLLGVACQDMGKQMALITDEHVRRGRRISEMEHRLNCSENTGEIVIARESARWSTIKWLGLAVVAAVMGAGGATATLLSRPAAAPVKVIKFINGSPDASVIAR